MYNFYLLDFLEEHVEKYKKLRIFGARRIQSL